MSAGKIMKKKASRAKRDLEKMGPGGKQTFRMLGENLLFIGYSDQSPLVYYLESEPENMFNYYKLGLDDEEERYAYDLRRHDPSHEFDKGENPVDIVKRALMELKGIAWTPEEFFAAPSALVKKQDEKFGVPERFAPEEGKKVERKEG